MLYVVAKAIVYKRNMSWFVAITTQSRHYRKFSGVSLLSFLRAWQHRTIGDPLAAELNARGIVTRRNGRWHVLNVRNLLGRLGERIATKEVSP